MYPDAERLLLRVSEAGERLGLSRSTIYELIGAGEIRVLKVGRATRIPVAELEAWVTRRCDTDVPTSVV